MHCAGSSAIIDPSANPVWKRRESLTPQIQQGFSFFGKSLRHFGEMTIRFLDFCRTPRSGAPAVCRRSWASEQAQSAKAEGP